MRGIDLTGQRFGRLTVTGFAGTRLISSRRWQGFWMGNIGDTHSPHWTMDMKIYRDVIQGTSQWAQLRCGIPTASNFHRILTPGGKISKQAQMYLYELLAEKMSGEPTVGYTSHWQDRGSQMEAEAVNFYSFQSDLDTEKIGFVVNDTETIGCSPDRFVAGDGVLEIKCPSPAVHVSYLLKKTVDADYYPQVMGNLWITERKWIDVLSYNPSLPPALIRVERDEAFIKDLMSAVTAFSEELEREWTLCISRGWVRTPKPREKSQSELMREALIEANQK